MMLTKNLFRNTFYTLIVLLFLQLGIGCKKRMPEEGGSFISKSESDSLINSFQKKYRNSEFPYGSTLDVKYIKQFMLDTAAANIRIYYGENSRTKTINLVAVAADKQGDDIIGRSCILIDRDSVKIIPVSTAAAYTRQFQKHYQNSPDIPYAEKFNIAPIKDLLRKPGAIKLQIKLGLSNKSNTTAAQNLKKVRLIIFAANAQNEILYGSLRNRKARSATPNYIMANYYFEDGAALENGQQCLDMCSMKSSLYAN